MDLPLVHHNLTTIPDAHFRQIISMKDDVHECTESKIDKKEGHIKISTKHMANNSLVMNFPSDETKPYYFEVQLMSANNSIVVGMLPEDIIVCCKIKIYMYISLLKVREVFYSNICYTKYSDNLLSTAPTSLEPECSTSATPMEYISGSFNVCSKILSSQSWYQQKCNHIVLS